MHPPTQLFPSDSPDSAPARSIARRLRTRRGAMLAPVGVLFMTLSCAAAAPASASNPPNIITRYAGLSGIQSAPTPGLATSSDLSYPQSATVDATGDLYIVDPGNNEIDEVSPAGLLSIVAGNGTLGTVTPGPARLTAMHNPQQVAFDSSGDMYIANDNDFEVDEVTPSGTLFRFAGTGTSGTPTAGLATQSHLGGPTGVAVDANNNVYISDSVNNEIEKVTSTDQLSVYATGLNVPYNIVLDSSGNIYVANGGGNDIVKVSVGGGSNPVVVAGTGVGGNPTAGLAVNSKMSRPQGLAIDSSGNIYVADSYGYDVLEVTPGGVLSVLSGTNLQGVPTFGGAALSSALFSPYGVAVDSTGVLYVADGSNRTIDRIGPAAASLPTITSTSPTQTSVTVTFSPPVSDGSSLITGYEASTDGGTTWHSVTTASGTAGSLQTTLGGLTAGTTVVVLVRADNASGAGTASLPVSVSLTTAPTSTTTTSTSSSTATTTTTTSTSTSTSVTATSTTATTATTASTSAAAPLADSAFSQLHAPYVNTSTGAIALYEAVQNPGTLTATAVYRNGTLGIVATTAALCPAFQAQFGAHCRPQWLAYGQGSSTVGSAGIVPLAISASGPALTLLHRAAHGHHAGIPLAIVVTFQSACGGAPVSHTVTVLATLHGQRAAATRARSTR